MTTGTGISAAKKFKYQTEQILHKKDSDVFDVIVLGAGIAGMTAAIYCARSELKVLILEQRIPGGQLLDIESIDNVVGLKEDISGLDLAENIKAQMLKNNVALQWGKVNQVHPAKPYTNVVTEEGKLFRARSLIIATGADPKKLEVPGERQFIGRGVSFSANCDGIFYKNKKVAVVGGNDAAIRESLYLTKYAREIVVIHRRDHFNAERVLVNKAFQNPKIKYIWNTMIEAIGGEGRVTNLKVRNINTDVASELYVDGLFVYIGNKPSTDFLEGVVKLDERGYIIVDEDKQTNVPGIFAIGEVCFSKVRQMLTIMADGVVAAHSLERYLNG